MSWRGLLAVAILVVHAGSAVADREIVELRYMAPEGCPARAVVEAAILERTPNVVLGAPARRVFEITIEVSPEGFRGALVVDRVADKQLSAPRCEDLAIALALVTALAIDPEAVRAPPRPAPVEPPVPVPAPGVAPARAWSWQADVGGMVESGVGPHMLLGGVVELRAGWRSYQLELGLIGGRGPAAEPDRGEGRARFTWLAARPAACRTWAWRGSRVSLAGCGHVEVGAVRARGDMIINERVLTRLWLAAGAHASGRYPLTSSAFAQLQIGASLPLVRDRYLFAPNVSIHETPSVTGWLLIGVGLQFL